MSGADYNINPAVRPITRLSSSGFRDEWLKKQGQPVSDKFLGPCDRVKNNSLSDLDNGHSTEFLETLNLKSKEKSAQNGSVSFNPRAFLSESTSLCNSPLCKFEESKNDEDSTIDVFLEAPVDTSRDLAKLNTNESHDSLGKTLAFSLQLIAAGNASISPQLPSMSEEISNSSPISFTSKKLKNEALDDSEDCVEMKEEESSTPRSRYMTRSLFLHNDIQSTAGSNGHQISTTVNENHDSITSDNQDLMATDNQDITEEKDKQSMVTRKRGRRKKVSGDCSVDKESVYMCSECGKAFNKSQTLRQHFITHTDRFACSFCNVRCKSKGDLRSHTQTHTKEKPYRCEVCNTFYTRESILKKHKLTQLHKNACFQLGNQLQLALKGEMKVNEGKRSKKNKYLCQQCPKKFESKQKLKQHFKLHSYRFSCPQCHKRCKTALMLRIHKRCHLLVDSFPCKFCSRVFPNLRLLKEHIRAAHSFLFWQRKFPGNLLKSLLAQKVENIADLRAEICRSVNPAAKLVCSVCSRNFKSKRAYEKHCAKHIEPCSFSPAEKSMVDHSTARKLSIYHCPECTKSFTNFDEFSKHHSDLHSDKPMTCHVCYSNFDVTTEFKSHVENHGPTMLFSGASLEESKIPHVNKRNKRNNARQSDSASKLCDEKQNKSTVKEGSQFDEESDDECFLESREFVHMISTALNDCSDDEKEDDSCDDGEELCQGLKILLYDIGQDCGTSVEKASNDKQENTDVKKHEVDTKMFCVQDDENNLYKCSPCDMLFITSSQLKDHMKSHVCTYCNVFCQTKESMSEHFHCQDRERKLQGMKSENERTETDLDEIEIHSDGTAFTSDDEMTEVFLDELEGILEYENKSTPSLEFLNTFSHDEIIRTNKKIFERYSCIDVPTNIYACIICKRKYARPTTLTRHFKTHVCHFCNTFFVDKTDLTDHKYKHRKKAAMIKAEISGESTSKVPRSPMVSKVNRELFKKFTIIDSTRNMNKCCLCDKLFVRKTVLTRHMKTHVCSYCDKFYEDKYELARHVSLHKMDSSHIPDDDSVHRQYRVYDEEKPFVPSSAFSNQLEEDGKIVGMGSSYPSSLPQFTATFSAPSTNSHETVTFIQIPVSETCADPSAVTFGPGITADAPTYQIIADTIVPNQGSYIVGPQSCHGDDSNKILALAQDHIVTGDRCPVGATDIFQCNICSKTFFKSGHLKSHISTHAAPPPYACRYCGKTFVRNGPLQKHEKTHDVKRCEHCDLSFTCQYELDHHMQIHESYPFYK